MTLAVDGVLEGCWCRQRALLDLQHLDAEKKVCVVTKNRPVPPPLSDTQGASSPVGIQLCGPGSSAPSVPAFPSLCNRGPDSACGRGLVRSDTRHRGNGLRVQSSTGKQGLNPHPPIRPCRFWGFGNVSCVDKGTTALYFDSRLHKLSLRAFPVPPDVTPFPRSLPQRTVC